MHNPAVKGNITTSDGQGLTQKLGLRFTLGLTYIGSKHELCLNTQNTLLKAKMVFQTLLDHDKPSRAIAVLFLNRPLG